MYDRLAYSTYGSLAASTLVQGHRYAVRLVKVYSCIVIAFTFDVSVK